MPDYKTIADIPDDYALFDAGSDDMAILRQIYPRISEGESALVLIGEGDYLDVWVYSGSMPSLDKRVYHVDPGYDPDDLPVYRVYTDHGDYETMTYPVMGRDGKNAAISRVMWLIDEIVLAEFEDEELTLDQAVRFAEQYRWDAAAQIDSEFFPYNGGVEIEIFSFYRVKLEVR